MTLRHMRIFLEVCNNSCNATKAAEAQHMTQPAVSLAIKELEQHYGTILFDRIGRRLQLTEAGMRLLEYAKRICASFDDMEQQLRGWDTAGVLRVGASITIGSLFLPACVKRFQQRPAKTDIKVLVTSSDQLERRILSNDLDIAFIEGIREEIGKEKAEVALTARPYMVDRLAVVCAGDYGFSAGETLSVAKFKEQRFLLREHGSGTREVFDRAAGAAGFSADPVWETTSTTALINAAIEGLGIAVLPRRMVAEQLQSRQLVELHVEGMRFDRQFFVIYHRDKYLTAAAKDFIALCCGGQTGA